ncbi:hypothetical protein BC332_01893 [Capsicum chinense]|nr:hypothetical protein BC332_01893 [Capsicum chinense]
MEFTTRRKLCLKPIETQGEDIDAAEEGLLSPSARLFHEPNFNVHIVAIMGIKSRINNNNNKPSVFPPSGVWGYQNLVYFSKTITGVALGVTQAGFSIYLNRRYGEGKKDRGATEKNNNLPYDPLDYIRGAKATIDRKKNSLEAIYTSFISELALKFFGIKGKKLYPFYTKVLGYLRSDGRADGPSGP